MPTKKFVSAYLAFVAYNLTWHFTQYYIYLEAILALTHGAIHWFIFSPRGDSPMGNARLIACHSARF